MYTTILWDVDGTIMNFIAAEKEAIKACFLALGMGSCDDAAVERYSKINVKYWEALERGEYTKPQILVKRFEEFFETEGLDPSLAVAFNDEYQVRLGDTVVFNDNAYELISFFKENGLRQYILTNGTKVAQDKKLSASHLLDLIDGVFISEIVGAEKPSVEHFNYVFSNIEEKDKSKLLMVGDSLTSDIQGANNANIPCCWYNPDGLTLCKPLRIDHIISNLNELKDII